MTARIENDIELVVADGMTAYAHGATAELAEKSFHMFTGNAYEILSITEWDTPNDWKIRYRRIK